MNPRKYFKIAKQVAILKTDQRHHRLGALGLRKDGTVVIACNGPATEHTPKIHAEARLARKLDKGGIVFVVRVARQDGSLRMARPCPSCLLHLKSKQVEKVYYSITNTEYGVLHL